MAIFPLNTIFFGTLCTYLHNIYQVSTNIPPGSPRVRAAAHLHPPGPLPQQAAAQAPGQGRGHLVGHPRQAPAHAQEGRQGEVDYFYPIIIAKQSVAFVTKSSR